VTNRTDIGSLQVIERTQLDIIANKAEYAGTTDNKQVNTTPLKSLLSAINSELQISYLMSESATPDLTVNIDSDTIQNPQTLRQRQHSLTKGNFSSGTVVFPAADAGTITVTPGTNSSLNLTVGNFVKMLIQIDEFGQLSVKPGVQGPVLSGIASPEPDGKHVGIGYIVLENNAGTIQNIENSQIYQYINQEINTSLTVQEIDGAPSIDKVVTLKFPNDSVTDDGNGVVTISLGESSKIVNDQGDSLVKLKPNTIDFVLESPDTVKWGFTVDDNGIILSESGSLNPVTDLKILRDDGIEVSFRVNNDGLLQAITPADVGTSLIDNIFLDSPEGTAWELKVTTTVADFILESPNGTLFNIGISDLGEFISTEVLIGNPQNIKLRRDDLTEIGITISNEGALETQNTPQVGAILKNKIFLASPDTNIWELKIDDDDVLYSETTVGVENKNVIYTSSDITYANKFQIQNDKSEPLFSVREFEEIDTSDILRTGAFIEMPILTLSELESIENPSLSSSKVTAEAYLDTGSGIRKVFYDTFDNEWKFMHDLSVVFP